jgi:cytochrome b
MTSKSIKVRDLFIRFFHWSMVVTFLTSYLTEGETNLHLYSGWYILLLPSLRVIWGFFGTKHARFRGL